MNEIRETISNYSPDPESEYCRLAVRQKLSWGKSDREELNDLSIPRNLQAASNYSTVEQEITNALCASLYFPEEEFKIFDATAYEKARMVLAKLRSSKEYSPTRTSPIINKLNEIWLISAAGFRGFGDIDRVHRNFYYDISSSDPVEEFVVFKSPDKSEAVSVIPGLQLSPEATTFCTSEGILNFVPVVTEIIQRSFQQIDKVRMAVEEDPETGERWLLIAITVRGEVEEILEQYDRYTEQWVSTAPWPERDKIRLSFNIT